VKRAQAIISGTSAASPSKFRAPGGISARTVGSVPRSLNSPNAINSNKLIKPLVPYIGGSFTSYNVDTIGENGNYYTATPLRFINTLPHETTYIITFSGVSEIQRVDPLTTPGNAITNSWGTFTQSDRLYTLLPFESFYLIPTSQTPTTISININEFLIMSRSFTSFNVKTLGQQTQYYSSRPLSFTNDTTYTTDFIITFSGVSEILKVTSTTTPGNATTNFSSRFTQSSISSTTLEPNESVYLIPTSQTPTTISIKINELSYHIGGSFTSFNVGTTGENGNYYTLTPLRFINTLPDETTYIITFSGVSEIQRVDPSTTPGNAITNSLGTFTQSNRTYTLLPFESFYLIPTSQTSTTISIKINEQI
jgi:uncharacterized protein with PQ loop repeat